VRKPILASLASNIGEYYAICETGVSGLSGAYIGLIDEKTEGRTSRATVPLR
jgi:hypothetical protein